MDYAGQSKQEQPRFVVDLKSTEEIVCAKIRRRSRIDRMVADPRLSRVFAAKLKWQEEGFRMRQCFLSLTPDLALGLGLRHRREDKRVFIEGEG